MIFRIKTNQRLGKANQDVETDESFIIHNQKIPICKIEAKFLEKKMKNHNYDEDIETKITSSFEANR